MSQWDEDPTKRAFQDGSRYHLPKDQPEHERLDTQSASLAAIMNNRPLHAAPSNPKRILDIGCGTGAITALLATTYPNAHVIGVDLAPVPESRHGKHPNLEYVQANVVDLIGQDPRFEPESFDYIFERLLVMGVSDWPGHVSSVSRLLKPGGYLELHEIDMDLLAPDEKPLKMEWYDAFLQDTRASSLDMQIGRKLPALLRSAPFENVQDFQYPFPPKPVEGQPQFDGMAGQLSAMFPLMITKVCGAQRGAEKAQEVVADFRRTYDPGFEPGTHWIMWVIVGQKK